MKPQLEHTRRSLSSPSGTDSTSTTGFSTGGLKECERCGNARTFLHKNRLLRNIAHETTKRGRQTRAGASQAGWQQSVHTTHQRMSTGKTKPPTAPERDPGIANTFYGAAVLGYSALALQRPHFWLVVGSMVVGLSLPDTALVISQPFRKFVQDGSDVSLSTRRLL
jgi:hypothetical protein